MRRLKMAVLTITDERLRAVDEFARIESRTRDDVVDEAIDKYLKRKSWDRLCTTIGEKMAARGITEEDINEAVREVRAEIRSSKQ
jgi:predicted transcriptional regulator